MKAQQISIGIQFIGFSYHLKKNPHPHLYKRKLDKKGNFVLNLGLVLQFEYPLNNWASIKTQQAFLFQDCAGKFASMSHFGFYFREKFNNNHQGKIGIGPIYYSRKTWNNLKGYVNDINFKSSKNKKWQNKFIWFGGTLEHQYFLNKNTSISTTILPGIPEIISIAPGISFNNN